MKVSFLIAGVQKGATSALHYYLRQHPDLYLPEKKELHFFDDEKINWYAPSYDTYHSHFHDAPEGSLWGEATPIYTYWQPSAGRIQNYNPHMKLIVILRDPVARAYSHWRMETARGTETLSFSQAIRKGRERVISEAEIPRYHRIYSYVERSFYADQIERLLKYFKRDQLLFITTQELLKRHEESLDQICNFLGVSHFNCYPEHKLIFSHNSSNLLVSDTHDIEYLRSLFYDDINKTQMLIARKIEKEMM